MILQYLILQYKIGGKVISAVFLAIDKDITVFERENKQWFARGIGGIRVDSMTEAVEMVLSNQFLFIGINADNITYLPTLFTLRETTNDPILVLTSAFSEDGYTKALQMGADYYLEFNESESKIKMILATVNRLYERTKQRKIANKITAHGDILIVASHHKAYINDVELSLTGTEMKILHYLMINRGNVISHKQIYRKICDGDYFESSADTIYSTLKRLRKKMREITETEYIETIKDVGYRLVTIKDKIE